MADSAALKNEHYREPNVNEPASTDTGAPLEAPIADEHVPGFMQTLEAVLSAFDAKRKEYGALKSVAKSEASLAVSSLAMVAVYSILAFVAAIVLWGLASATLASLLAMFMPVPVALLVTLALQLFIVFIISRKVKLYLSLCTMKTTREILFSSASDGEANRRGDSE